MVRRFWNYIRAAVEGQDGKLSYRRICAFWVMWLITKTVNKGFDNGFQVDSLWVLVGLFLLLTAIVTFDQLDRFKNGRAKKEDQQPN